MTNIDNEIRNIHATWEKSKNEWQHLYALLSHLTTLQRAVVEHLQTKGLSFSEASHEFSEDLAKYQEILSKSFDDLLHVEEQYKQLLAIKGSAS